MTASMSRRSIVKALAAGLVLLSAVIGRPDLSRAAEDNDWQSWTTDGAVTNGIIGRIWSVENRAFIEPSALVDSLKDARFVLLGETHDNPAHHRLQAFLTGAAAPERPATVVMEMLTEDQAPALEKFRTSPDRSAETFGKTVSWEKSGWPDYAIYRPIIEAALKRGADIRAGLPGKTQTRAIGKDGLSSLSEAQQKDLRLSAGLPEGLATDLKDEIITSHCDLLPDAMVPNMMAVQRYRDAYLADALRKTPADGLAILIAGGGHVRKDRAVPFYLEPSDGAAVTVNLVEIDPERTEAEILADARENKTAHYIWFTPKIDREDPCEALRKRFSDKKKDG
ncbi:ChaN family lipoprotein [uncultured Roseibium sp.]|uniref:ChaN family lipoprotein n=1 Tax=uncultured Roseibium sp. TaxID=1936171 RepID=UPI0032164584